ncbi:hypothetical protein Ahy_A01g003815 [Arachis hypogaea]|uniref:Replication protein A 70 kDa DNA-binding subunit B/D first OB fold domain-containing protein n=1 Tax=Arachis hypogaea TaxID=3818 RepID=A0A445EUG8_ARAHY|nr:hypothetical protein Ahy_A01g003815 [Arachis hypogaea]
MTTAMDMNLKVRVIRLWTVPTFTGQLLPNFMEMILVDEFGCKIQATIRKTMIYRFKQLLSEGRNHCNFIPKSALTISLFTELLETKED